MELPITDEIGNENKAIDFLRSKIKEKLEQIKGQMEPLKYKLCIKAVEECNDIEKLKDLNEMEYQIEMFEYIQKNIKPLMEPADEKGLVDQIRLGGEPNRNEILELLGSDGIKDELAGILGARLNAEPEEERNRKEIMDRMELYHEIENTPEDVFNDTVYGDEDEDEGELMAQWEAEHGDSVEEDDEDDSEDDLYGESYEEEEYDSDYDGNSGEDSDEDEDDYFNADDEDLDEYGDFVEGMESSDDYDSESDDFYDDSIIEDFEESQEEEADDDLELDDEDIFGDSSDEGLEGEDAESEYEDESYDDIIDDEELDMGNIFDEDSDEDDEDDDESIYGEDEDDSSDLFDEPEDESDDEEDYFSDDMDGEIEQIDSATSDEDDFGDIFGDEDDGIYDDDSDFNSSFFSGEKTDKPSAGKKSEGNGKTVNKTEHKGARVDASNVFKDGTEKGSKTQSMFDIFDKIGSIGKSGLLQIKKKPSKIELPKD